MCKETAVCYEVDSKGTVSAECNTTLLVRNLRMFGRPCEKCFNGSPRPMSTPGFYMVQRTDARYAMPGAATFDVNQGIMACNLKLPTQRQKAILGFSLKTCKGGQVSRHAPGQTDDIIGNAIPQVCAPGHRGTLCLKCKPQWALSTGLGHRLTNKCRPCSASDPDGSLAKKPLSQVWKFNRVRVLTGTAAGLQGWAATSVKARPYFRNLAVPNGCPMAIARASARAQAAADSLAQAKIAAIKAGRSTKTVEFGVDGQVVQEGEQEREQDDRHERGGGHKRRHGHGHKRHGCYKCRFLVGAACALGAVYAGYRYKQSDAKTSSKWLVTLAVLAVLSVGLVARHHMHGHGHGRGHHGHHHGGEHDGHHHGGGFHKRGGCRMSKLAIGAAALLAPSRPSPRAHPSAAPSAGCSSPQCRSCSAHATRRLGLR